MNDLLKVLDMSEDEQIRWVSVKFPAEHIHSLSVASAMKITHPEQIMTRWNTPTNRRILADLAFRLRDEAKDIKEIKDGVILSLPWLRACYLVVNGKLDSYANVNGGEEAEYKILKREPIVWIIAALIAKGKDNE